MIAAESPAPRPTVPSARTGSRKRFGLLIVAVIDRTHRSEYILGSKQGNLLRFAEHIRFCLSALQSITQSQERISLPEGLFWRNSPMALPTIVNPPTVVPPHRPHQGSEPAWEVALLFPPQGEWSEDEYLALDTNRLVELSDGRLEVLPMPAIFHQFIVRYLFQLLDAYVVAHASGEVLFAPLPVRLWSLKFREPDIIYLRPSESAMSADRRRAPTWSWKWSARAPKIGNATWRPSEKSTPTLESPNTGLSIPRSSGSLS